MPAWTLLAKSSPLPLLAPLALTVTFDTATAVLPLAGAPASVLLASGLPAADAAAPDLNKKSLSFGMLSCTERFRLSHYEMRL
jgi:hypothetical protein